MGEGHDLESNVAGLLEANPSLSLPNKGEADTALWRLTGDHT